MPRKIAGITYYTATEVASEVGCSRTTLWRWLRSGLLPRGRRYRNVERLFTIEELNVIRAHSVRMETVDDIDTVQLGLFRAGKK